MIEASHLTKTYGPMRGIADVSFAIQPGEIVGLLGPNGAGKSTTIRILTGYLPPNSGFARVGGFDTLTQSRQARRRIGYLPENVAIYPRMRVEEYLRYRAALKDVPRGERARRIEVALERCRLVDVRRRIAGQLSKGYRQRLGLAGALVSDPPVLVLDEPTVGLDPNQVVEMRSLVQELAEGHTILLSTHILPEVEAICSRVLVLSQGKLIVDDSIDRLVHGVGDRTRIRAVVRGGDGALEDRLRAIAGVESVASELEGEPGCLRMRVEVAAGVDAREAVHRAIVESGAVALELGTTRASLEEVFGGLTRHDVALERPSTDGAAAAPVEAAAR